LSPIDLESRRLTWIQTLRSGNLRQGWGALMEDNEGTPSFCCLGVGRSVIPSGQSWVVNRERNMRSDGNRDYEYVMNVFDMPARMKVYLVAMNDGMYLLEQAFGLQGNYNREGFNDEIDAGRKIIRNTKDRRDFNYIARFLEIAWKLTAMNTADSAIPQST
jgi:hypothetical protein